MFAGSASRCKRIITIACVALAVGTLEGAQGSSSVTIAPSSLGYVNVREKPGLNSRVIGRVRPGERYLSSSARDGWIWIDAKKGWIAGRYAIVGKARTPERAMFASQPSSEGDRSRAPACNRCEASLLIVADDHATIRVDGHAIRSLAKGESTLVRVDVGEHLVEATASDVKWERVIIVEKPGQILVRTLLHDIREQKRAADLLEPTIAALSGQWHGEYFYWAEDCRDGRICSSFYEGFIVTIAESGSCSLRHLTGHESGTYGIDRFDPRHANRRTNVDLCELAPDLSFSHADRRGVLNTAGTINFTFETVWTKRTLTITLARQR